MTLFENNLMKDFCLQLESKLKLKLFCIIWSEGLYFLSHSYTNVYLFNNKAITRIMISWLKFLSHMPYYILHLDFIQIALFL